MQAPETAASQPVLCVDLDGTLISSDVIWESILVLLKFRPYQLFFVPFWLLRGRAHLKKRLAEVTGLNVAALPYRVDVLEFVKAEHDRGRKIALVTASDLLVAQKISVHLGIFDQVLATNGERNLKGKEKAALLSRTFGERNFDYVGDSSADIPAWSIARSALVVGGKGLVHRAGKVASVGKVFRTPRASIRTWFRALRGQHWMKNSLLFLPLVLAHTLHPKALLRTVFGFAVFGMCASGLYVVNDLLDLHSDRFHPWKHKRPFAAGEIPIWEGILISLVLFAVSLVCGFLLSTQFLTVLLIYSGLTMCYSLYLKRIALLDAFVLSSFYSIRIFAGSTLTAVPLSQWFLAFSMFFFLSLAMAKRYSELVGAADLLKSGRSGRGYLPGDRELLLVLGVASSFSAVVVFTLYVHSQDVLRLYRRPEPLLFLTPLVLYWLSRIWLQAHRGRLTDDPVTLALRDPVSYAVAAISAVIISMSMVLPG